MKKVIRITESKLRQMVMESVSRVLKEGMDTDNSGTITKIVKRAGSQGGEIGFIFTNDRAFLNTLKDSVWFEGQMDYENREAEMQIGNCGYVILDTKYLCPIDDEYELGDAYVFIDKYINKLPESENAECEYELSDMNDFDWKNNLPSY